MISTLDQFCSDVSSFQGWLVVVVIIIDDSQKLLGWIWVGSVQPPKLKKKKDIITRWLGLSFWGVQFYKFSGEERPRTSLQEETAFSGPIPNPPL